MYKINNFEFELFKKMSRNENETSKKVQNNKVANGDGSNEDNGIDPGIEINETDIDNINDSQTAPLKEED